VATLIALNCRDPNSESLIIGFRMRRSA
jgi:hypothetical protein